MTPERVKRFMLAVNPSGGIRRSLEILDAVRPVFDEAGMDLKVWETEYAGHAADMIHSMDLGELDGFCIIGGDGTLHELVNGLLTRADGATVPVGCIPGGTGNSFMHHLECLDAVKAARRIVRGNRRPIDVARVTTGDETVYCFNIVGWGIVTDINRMAERIRWLGESRYSVSTLAHIVTLRRRRARVILDDEEWEDEFIFLMGCNTRYTGKGMLLAPRARIGDGLIDVVMIRDARRWELLKMFPKVFDGSHLEFPFVEYRQVRSFSVMPSEDEILNLDGELKGSTPFTVDMVPGAFEVFAS
ncbi:MAG: diacylglycerol/lipid kinase family protein [Fidelibacterota bacterium]